MVFMLRMVGAFFALLPLGLALSLGRGMGWVYGNVIRYHRRDAFVALERAFPEKTPEERKAIVREVYTYLGLNLAEFLRIMGGRIEEAVSRVEIKGTEHIEAALAQGKGVLALVSHLGNWEYMALAVARHFPPSGMIVKEMRHEGISEYFIKSRQKQGILLYPRRGSYRNCLRALQKGTLIGFALDQNMMWKEGVFVDFFGKLASTSPGLAHLAASSGAPVLPITAHRLPDGRHEVVAHPPMDPLPDRSPESIHAATQAYTLFLEEAIREWPDQWIWVHRRWNTTPEDVEQQKKMKSEGLIEQPAGE